MKQDLNKNLMEFDQLKSDVTVLVQPTFKMVVTDFASSQQAIEATKQVQALANQVEKKRKEMTNPLNAEAKRIKGYADDIKLPLEKAENYLRDQLNRFAEEQEKIRQAELKRVEAERRRLEAELLAKQAEEAKSVDMLKDIQSDAESIFGNDGSENPEIEAEKQAIEIKHAQEQAILKGDFQEKRWDVNQQQIKNTRRSYTVEIEDLAQVPKEFLIITVNDKAAIAAHKAGTKIPGLKFKESISVAIGAKTRVPREALE